MLAVFVILFGMSGIQTQVSGETDGSKKGNLSPQELEKLVGPIALYPDDLVGIVLPASTNTLQLVQAARFMQKHKKDSSLKPNKDWDPSVLGLLNYPEVINLMNEDLKWTQNLGDAVINQQQDVMAAIQSFRKKAQAVGNLKTSEKQIIIVEKEVIKIVSADPQVIYVPVYQPTTVIYTTTPVYYSSPYPVYYRPAAAFWTGMFVGSAIRYGTGWRRGGGDINVNRSVNISGGDRNVNVGGGGNRPSQQPAGGGGRGGGSSQQWKPSQSSQQRTAARTGQNPSQRPSGGSGAGGRGGASAQTGQQGKAGGQSRPGSQPSRSGGNSPTSGYKSGSTARADSSRGSQSRASSSRTSGSRSSSSSSRSSSRGGSRGGGRSGGGGRRR
jgi:hypothetical protein